MLGCTGNAAVVAALLARCFIGAPAAEGHPIRGTTRHEPQPPCLLALRHRRSPASSSHLPQQSARSSHPCAGTATAATLVAPSANTHQVDMSQRVVFLTVVPNPPGEGSGAGNTKENRRLGSGLRSGPR